MAQLFYRLFRLNKQKKTNAWAQREYSACPHGLAENQGVTNRIQSLLGVEYPVVQAPMTYIARAELAAAVSEGGGMGMIETLTPEGRADLRRVRELTDRPVAANLMIQGWKRDPSIVDELVAAEVRHVFTSAGDPAL